MRFAYFHIVHNFFFFYFFIRHSCAAVVGRGWWYCGQRQRTELGAVDDDDDAIVVLILLITLVNENKGEGENRAKEGVRERGMLIDAGMRKCHKTLINAPAYVAAVANAVETPHPPSPTPSAGYCCGSLN